MKRTLIASSMAALGLACTLHVSAHHSFTAEYDIKKPISMTGTVTSVEWQNPHTWFYIDVKDDAGNVTNWGMELASPNLLVRNGWTKSTLKAGDVVNVEGYGAKNGKNIGNARTIVITATGQRLVAGSSAGSAP
jgi:DNA/RNA endonuclease YhcR with UshA esterase domain